LNPRIDFKNNGKWKPQTFSIYNPVKNVAEVSITYTPTMNISGNGLNGA
jgi:hypothetical protein